MGNLSTTAMNGQFPIMGNLEQNNLSEESQLGLVLKTDGYLLHAERYCGEDNDLMNETGLDRRGDVLLGLIKKCEVKAGSTVTFDNIFTSLPLLHELEKHAIFGLGTL